MVEAGVVQTDRRWPMPERLAKTTPDLAAAQVAKLKQLFPVK